MKPVGKMYLIKIEPVVEDKIGDIFIPQTAALNDTIPYIRSYC